jgi:site-specific DNA-methyltransferase (adenine-specific)
MQSSRWQLEAFVPEDEFERYIVETCEARKELTSISLVRLGKKEKRDRRRAKLVAKGKAAAQSPLLIGLHVGDIATVSAKLTPGSVDVIITDPPYSKEYLNLYATLSQSAATILKPGGSCFVMTGQSYLPDVIVALSKSLRYNWIIAYLTPGGMAAQLWNRKVNTFWKPVLWFVNGKYDGDWKSDVVSSKVNDDDKRFHEWGQSESGMLRLVEAFTQPGDLVFDPFLGAGTTGLACLLTKRRFIGSDIDARSVDLARGRLVEASVLA